MPPECQTASAICLQVHKLELCFATTEQPTVFSPEQCRNRAFQDGSETWTVAQECLFLHLLPQWFLNHLLTFIMTYGTGLCHLMKTSGKSNSIRILVEVLPKTNKQTILHRRWMGLGVDKEGGSTVLGMPHIGHKTRLFLFFVLSNFILSHCSHLECAAREIDAFLNHMAIWTCYFKNIPSMDIRSFGSYLK